MVKMKQAYQRKPVSFKRGAIETPATDADPSKITPVQKRDRFRSIVCFG
jgi:hypothetical protein